MAAPPEPITPPRAHSLDSEGPELGEKGSTEDDCSESPAVSWMLRVRSRNDELKRFFGLPPTENLLDEFHCALRWRILLQGRMYVFDRYVCFYSNVFGYLKNKSIALQDVIAVKKKTHFRFPNSVELDCRDGNRYFFTSFLSRDEAYRLITNAWHQCSDIRQDNSSEEGTLSMSTSSPPSLSAPNTRRSLSVNIPSLDNPAHDSSAPVSTRSERRVFFGVGSVRTPGGPRQQPQQQPLRQTMSEGSGLLTRSVGEYLGDSRGTLLTDHDRDEEDDGMSEEDSNEDKLFAGCNPTDTTTATTPPEPHKEYKLLFSYELPCTPREFYARFLCNNSHFFEECHEAAGDKRVILSSWRRDEQLGLVRDLSFVTPIKSAFANWGTAQTQCYQTQRISCYSNQTLVLETSQNMTDIPYGDCFSVDMYFKIAPTTPAATASPAAAATAAASCSFQAHLRVNFTRKCLFKRIIDSGTQKECVVFYTDLFNRARDALENPNAPAAPAANGVSTPTYHAAGSPMAAPAGDKQQPGHQRMPSLPSMDHSSLAYAIPGQGFVPGSTAGDTQGGQGMGRGMFGLHPAVLLMLVTSLLLQVVLLVAWLWPAVPAAAVYTAPQHWLQRLAALQEESRLLQARMDLVAKEAAATMQQLQQQFLSPT